MLLGPWLREVKAEQLVEDEKCKEVVGRLHEVLVATVDMQDIVVEIKEPAEQLLAGICAVLKGCDDGCADEMSDRFLPIAEKLLYFIPEDIRRPHTDAKDLMKSVRDFASAMEKYSPEGSTPESRVGRYSEPEALSTVISHLLSVKEKVAKTSGLSNDTNLMTMVQTKETVIKTDAPLYYKRACDAWDVF